MARQPNQHGNPWLNFIFGDPRRFFLIVGVCVVILAILFPYTAQRALYNVMYVVVGALAPLAGPLIAIGIALYAIFGIMFKPRKSKKKKKGH